VNVIEVNKTTLLVSARVTSLGPLLVSDYASEPRISRQMSKSITSGVYTYYILS